MRYADFETLAEGLDYAAQTSAGFNFYSARGELQVVLTYAELRARAIDLARGLIGAGLARGDRFLLVAETDADFMVAFFACQYAGLLPASAPIPTSLGGRAEYIGALRRLLASTGAKAAMAPATLVNYLKEAAEGLSVPLIGSPDDFYALPGKGSDLRTWRADERCYLQFSSGSTRFPHGIDIPQRALMANAHAITRDGLRIGAGDRCTSWLPLYHDMGLVGFTLVPLLTQMSVDYLATRDFARRPLMWPRLITMNGGTLSYSPSFGYDLAARRIDHSNRVEGIDLSTWRGAGIGGDMIQPRVLERFAEVFAPYGFRREAFVPSYGMAETVLAISFAPLDTGVQIDRVDRRRLATDSQAVSSDSPDDKVARDFVLCGRLLGGHRAEIRDEDGRGLPDRRLGRIFVHGPSIMAGYFEEPETTAVILDADGWLDTGDLGYTIDGNLVVTGRSKDLIIINGRNVWPQDLEWSVEEQLALRRGDTAAFAYEDETGVERVMMLVQCRVPDAERRDQLARDVVSVLQRAHAVDATVALVPPHGLPQTSSGKLSRAKAKANWLAGFYAAGPDGARKPTAGAA